MTDPIPTDDQPHDEAEALLPWYATGQLDAADRARVEHHLATCARCQRQLTAERRLIDEFQMLTPEVDSGWARLRGQLEPSRRQSPKLSRPFARYGAVLNRPAVAAFAVVQLAFVIVAGAVLLTLSRAPYQTLSDPPPAPTANIIVMFYPNSSEADLRNILDLSGATFVGGPTDADAYLLHVPADSRPRSLATLRADPHVIMAQPIDGEQP